MMYLWLKTLHVVFVIAWFAGIFYLPRLFVYHAGTTDDVSIQRFKLMERRLFLMMTLCAALAVLFGALMLAAAPGLLRAGWLHAKLTLVLLLLIYHYACLRLMQTFRAGQNRRSERWYRWFNETPLALLIAIVALAVVKPF